MSGNELKSLPSDTVRLIGSSQVITSVFSIVKELVENSIDAEATSVEVKLEDYGFDKVEIRDNGHGIKSTDIPLVAKRHHTSKIRSFNDLSYLSTYGFRGEALGSLCAVSSLSVTTKTPEEDVSHSYSFDFNGNILTCQPSHLGQGTTVEATCIFKNVPVRRQFYKNEKRKKEEIKKIEDLLMAYGVIRPELQLILKNNKNVVWQKSSMTDTKNVLFGILGSRTVANLEQVFVNEAKSQVHIMAFLPKLDADPSLTSRSTNDRCFVSVNKRPVQLKDIEKLVQRYYGKCTGSEGRYPVFVLHVAVPSTELDVNVDANKTLVRINQQIDIMKTISSLLESLYGPLDSSKEGLHQEHVGDIDNMESPKEGLHQEHVGDCDNDILDNSLVVSYRSSDIGGIPADLFVTGCENSFDDSLQNDASRLCSVKDDSEIIKNADSMSNFSSKNAACSSDIKLPTSKDMHDTDDINKSNSSWYVTCGLEMTGGVTQTVNPNFNIIDQDLEFLLEVPPQSTPDFHETESHLCSVTNTVDIFTQSNTENKNFKDKNVCNNFHAAANNTETSENTPIILHWSKGLSNSNGKLLEPVQLLVGNNHAAKKRPLSPTQELEKAADTPSSKKNKVFAVQINQPTLYDIMGKNLEEKLQGGFVAFSRKNRPEVVEEHPDANYEEITQIVRSKWESLSEFDKREYVDSWMLQVQDINKKVVESKGLVKIRDKITKHLRAKLVTGSPSVREKLIASSKPLNNTGHHLERKHCKGTFVLEKLKQLYASGIGQSQCSKNDEISLIGPLKYYSGWVCYHDNKLKILNPHRVEEVLLYKELMDNHIIPSSRLAHSIGITPSNIGADLYKQLVNLVPECTAQTYTYIDDKRLKANGIEVQCHLDIDCQAVMEIVGLATCISTYGIKDLQEVLELIMHNNATTVHQSRPLKVMFYLQGETIRMIRQCPVNKTRDEMLELIQQMPSNCVKCLHEKPFMHSLYDMDNIPLLQSAS